MTNTILLENNRITRHYIHYIGDRKIKTMIYTFLPSLHKFVPCDAWVDDIPHDLEWEEYSQKLLSVRPEACFI